MQDPTPFDWQGHRGARGLVPENTIPAFIRALDLGMRTLEMDVVISKDHQVVLSHEPVLSPDICLDPQGKMIENDVEWNLYEMDYALIATCDCGSKPHRWFPDQEKFSVSKPLLSTVIDSVERYVRENGLPKPFYNIETKSSPKGDGTYHPAPDEFVELVVRVIDEKQITRRTLLQSFDIRTLKVARQEYPALKLVLLVENGDPAEENLRRLGFDPHVYSPYFPLVDKSLVEQMHARGILIIPWTVNSVDEIQRLRDMGVDGVITDFPNLKSAFVEKESED